jgi:hypothetical protein
MASDPERTRFVVFMTDGLVTVDRQVLATIADRAGRARLFVFGVGDAPNRFLLDEMARVGGGKVTWMRTDDATPDTMVDRFLDTIQRPVLSDIEIDWGDWDAQDVTPDRLPILFADQPAFVSARFRGEGDAIVVRGRVGDRLYEEVLAPIHAGREGARSIPVTWARQRIAALERQLFWGHDDEVRREIVDLSLAYRVLSRFTAFVAVDGPLPSPTRTPGFHDQALSVPPFGRRRIRVEDTAVRQGSPVGYPVGRSYEQVVQTVAGVTGGSSPNVSGGASNENAYLLDGATVTDPVTGTFSNQFNFAEIILGGDDLAYAAPESPLSLPRPPTGGQPRPTRPGVPEAP